MVWVPDVDDQPALADPPSVISRNSERGFFDRKS